MLQILDPRWISTCTIRPITTSSRCKNRARPVRTNVRAGVLKRSRLGNVPITYEQAQQPENIGVTKAWNTWNTSKFSPLH